MAASRSVKLTGERCWYSCRGVGQRTDERLGVVLFEPMAAFGEVCQIGDRIGDDRGGDQPRVGGHNAESREPAGR